MCCSSSLEWTEPALRGATCLLHCLVKLDRVIDTFGYAIRRNSDERRPPRVAGLTSSDSGLAQTPAYHLEDLAVCPPAAEKGARCNGARSRLFLIPPPPPASAHTANRSLDVLFNRVEFMSFKVLLEAAMLGDAIELCAVTAEIDLTPLAPRARIGNEGGVCASLGLRYCVHESD